MESNKMIDESTPIVPDNVIQFRSICGELGILYERKNSDYGDSFHLSFLEEGMVMPQIRLGDKYNRFKTLTKKGEQKVNDESIRDTLLDLASYAIMTVMELDGRTNIFPENMKVLNETDEVGAVEKEIQELKDKIKQLEIEDCKESLRRYGIPIDFSVTLFI